MRRKKCRCGCGNINITCNGYTRGHWHRGDGGFKRLPRAMPCECGCGAMTRPGSRFINGHGRRGKGRIISDPQPCSCGCGNLTSSGRTYVSGHNPNPNKKIKPELQPCGCGCGMCASPGKKYLRGHFIRTDEFREKLSASCTGWHHTSKTRLQLSKSKSGEKNPQWTGGFWSEGLKIYHPYLTRHEFGEIRKAALHRDKFTCILCKRSGSGYRIGVHHIVPVKIGYKSRLCDCLSNMITLCASCHKNTEPNGKGRVINPDKWREFLPFAKAYLSQFGYKEMLLDKYIVGEKKCV